jgi:ABC-type Mn2+/Zn2+ transport system permease subunit
VRLPGFVFLALVGACTAESAQAVGALLLLGPLAAPAGAAVRLTTRPTARWRCRRRSRWRTCGSGWV